jgi:hypothetical protein
MVASAMSGTMMTMILIEERVMAILSFVRILAPTGLLLIVGQLIGLGYRDGPAPEVTGGFGEPSCHECHFDQRLNDPAGTLRLSGVPDRYFAGRSYPLTVTLSRAGMVRGGFEISARFLSGRRQGQQAGLWRVLDRRLQVARSDDDPPVFFVQHNSTGSEVTEPGTARWTMEWAAPEDGAETVQFNVAANASNDDASALGDFVYLAEVRSGPQ